MHYIETKKGLDTLLKRTKEYGEKLSQMCCRHTAADAFQNNYKVIFAKEATNSFTEEDYLYGLKYAKETYGADALSNEQLFELFKK